MLISQWLSVFLPARRYGSEGNRNHNVSVCLSVCLSVTHPFCVKTKTAISSPCGSPMILVLWRHKILRGSPPSGASKKGRVGKFSDFRALSNNISKTAADTAKVTISDE